MLICASERSGMHVQLQHPSLQQLADWLTNTRTCQSLP